MNRKGKLLQMKTENMFERVYNIVAQIPWGKVTTYGQIAGILGNRRLSRAVGYALHNSPGGLPCHRVVDRHGTLAAVFEHDGINEQRLLLEEEGITFTADGRVVLEDCMWYGNET